MILPYATVQVCAAILLIFHLLNLKSSMSHLYKYYSCHASDSGIKSGYAKLLLCIIHSRRAI